MIVLDASFAYALLDADDAGHAEAAAWYRASSERIATTPLILAEVDHLALNRGGPAGATAFRREATSGAYEVHWWSGALVGAVAVAEQYRDLRISLADASLVALAAELRTTTIATFDERHFRAVRPLTGEPAFTLLPSDAELA